MLSIVLDPFDILLSLATNGLSPAPKSNECTLDCNKKGFYKPFDETADAALWPLWFGTARAALSMCKQSLTKENDAQMHTPCYRRRWSHYRQQHPDLIPYMWSHGRLKLPSGCFFCHCQHSSPHSLWVSNLFWFFPHWRAQSIAAKPRFEVCSNNRCPAGEKAFVHLCVPFLSLRVWVPCVRVHHLL